LTNNSNYFGTRARNWTLLAMTAFTIGLTIAHASVIVSVQSVTVGPGSSGDGFDVLLTNSGPSSITVGAFSFGITIADSMINFTDANTSTAVPYVLAGDSLFGPDLTGPTSGQSLISSDVALYPLSGGTLASGVTEGLGHILFNVAANAAPGQYAVSLGGYPTTSLSDPAGSVVSITTLTSGQITIASVSTVPEPSSILLLLAIGPMALASRTWRRGSRLRARTPRQHQKNHENGYPA
jgi:hypothetical protein